MSLPPINPEKSVAGIALDPKTLDRVIPESKRPDGSVRKQIRIRPGFTPQEDIRRFRGTKQARMDSNALPKGHIIGWTPPTSATKPGAGSAPLSKNAKKRQKQKEKKAEAIKDNWEDEDEEGQASTGAVKKTASTTSASSDVGKESSGTHTPDRPNGAVSPTAEKNDNADRLAAKLENLNVQ